MTVRGNYFDGEAFVVVENQSNRLTAEGTAPYYDQVNLYESIEGEWHEIIVWDCVEWREEGNEAFEAILGVIARIVGGVRVERP